MSTGVLYETVSRSLYAVMQVSCTLRWWSATRNFRRPAKRLAHWTAFMSLQRRQWKMSPMRIEPSKWLQL